MRIVDRGLVFDASTAASEKRACIFTSAVVRRNGRILVAFHVGSAKDAADEGVMIRASADGAQTWHTVAEEVPPPGAGWRWRSLNLGELDDGRLLGAFTAVDRSDPSLPLANPATTGILPTQVIVMESADGGAAWARPRAIDSQPLESIVLAGPILKLANSGLALECEAWKSYHDTTRGQHHAALWISADGGQTFEGPVVVAHDPAGDLLFWDERMGVDPRTGRIIALFWTHNRSIGRDVNVHVAWGSPDGKAWTAPHDAGFAGQIAFPLVLPDPKGRFATARVLACYVHRHDPPSLRAVLSADFGKTWDTANELVFYRAQAAEAGMVGERAFGDYWDDMNRWSFGHPEAHLLPDGDVLVVFYAGATPQLSMHWVRIAL